MSWIPHDKCKEVVEHLLENVIGLDSGNDVMKALEYFMGIGQIDIYRLTEMTPIQLQEMKYKGDKGALCLLPKGLTTCLVAFRTILLGTVP